MLQFWHTKWILTPKLKLSQKIFLSEIVAMVLYKYLKDKHKFSGPLLQINKQKQKHVICVFCFLLDLHIAVDKFYLFYLRRASIFVQQKSQISFLSWETK